MATQSQRIHEKAKKPKRDTNVLRFPHNLGTDGNGNVIRFRVSLPEGSKYFGGKYQKQVDKEGNSVTSVFRQKGSNSIARKFSSNYTRTTSVVDLYMPPSIQSSYQSDWGTTELGSMGAGADAATGVMNASGMDDAKNIWQAVKDVLPQSLVQTFAGTIQSLSPLNVSDLRAVKQATVRNPYMEVIFNGVSNRTFSFTFKMVPRNESEQRTINRIVNEFKFHRAPEVQFDSNNNYFRFPSEFDIEFLNRNTPNPWIFKISTCALTNFTVNHTPEGQYAAMVDGSPFATEITLEFTELEILTKERHAEGY